jgi:hypothetical protein
MITKGTQDYKEAQRIANRLTALAESNPDGDYAVEFEDVLDNSLQAVMRLDCFASQVATTVYNGRRNNYVNSYKYRSIMRMSSKQAWIIACAMVENGIKDKKIVIE